MPSKARTRLPRFLIGVVGALVIAAAVDLFLLQPSPSSAGAHLVERCPSPCDATRRHNVGLGAARAAPPGPPYAIEDQTIVLVDPARPTPARTPVAAKPGRVLRTIIRRPAGVSGPIPLVVFAHGYDSEPEVYEPLLDTWAAAGYMVAAPDSPGSARRSPGRSRSRLRRAGP